MRKLLLPVVLTALVACDRPPTPAPPVVASRTITIAAASDLRFALDDVLAAFQKKQPDVKVEVTYGSSGSFFAQLENGAPFDVYLSADAAYPRQLADKSQGLEPVFVYAIGRLALLIPKDSPLDLEKRAEKVLLDDSVKHVAIANPKTAPYGRAAKAAIEKLGLAEKVTQKLVLGDNVAQTAQLVESGAAQAGIVAYSLALAPALKDRTRHLRLPDDVCPTIEQGGLVLKRAKDPEAAKAFAKHLTSPEAATILEQHGFSRPPGH